MLQLLKRKKKTNRNIPLVLLPISNSPGKYVYYCPGCEANHVINTNPVNQLPLHKIIGSLDKLENPVMLTRQIRCKMTTLS